MLLIYSHKITPRLRYVFKQMFTYIHGVPIKFTTKIETFIAHKEEKLSYTKKALSNELFFKSTDLLFENNIRDISISVKKTDAYPIFFEHNEETSALSFDVFAASFYLISRYEEYLPVVKDIHGRFKAENSLAYQHHFLQKPLIDIWANKLIHILKDCFPDFQTNPNKFVFLNTFDIDNAYAFKHKGLLRWGFGALQDFLRLDFTHFSDRVLVLLQKKKDPYDTYDFILKTAKEYNLKTLFFILLGKYGSYDKNIAPFHPKYRELIKHLSDFTEVQLHPSYESAEEIKELHLEKDILENIIHFPVTKSRQHYIRFSIPETYRNLISADIKEDYSMGYSNQIGFRASTCTPFYFFDVIRNSVKPIKVHPFVAMDIAFENSLKVSEKEALKILKSLLKITKNLNGEFALILHNESFSGQSKRYNWKKIYQQLLKEI